MAQRTDDDRFGIETMKLLLQVAWAEGGTNLAEKRILQGLGRSWSVPERELQKIVALLEAGKPLPAPDMSVLKARPDEVLEAVQALIAADGRIAPDEERVLEEIKGRLDEP
jgi:hypothetical protein